MRGSVTSSACLLALLIVSLDFEAERGPDFHPVQSSLGAQVSGWSNHRKNAQNKFGDFWLHIRCIFSGRVQLCCFMTEELFMSKNATLGLLCCSGGKKHCKMVILAALD